MKAVGYKQAGATDNLKDIEQSTPVASGRDLLVRVQAVSVNPVDTKLRAGASPAAGEYKVLGFDAVGVVHSVGADVALFKPGDAVWYAGAIDRPGTNSEFHLIDERIVGRKPASLSAADAAALPLTAITAWELLFDRLRVPRGAAGGTAAPATLLVVGAAGGVGSILVQLARQLTGLTVVGTASRPETRDWVMEMGAHHVIDHHHPMPAQIAQLALHATEPLPPVQYVIGLSQTDRHFDQLVEILAPQGKLALIDDPGPFDARLLKRKSLSLHWELMFTRSLYQTDDMQAQHVLLNEVANLLDQGVLRTTARQHLGAITAANLATAHGLLESSRTMGKVVLVGF